MPGGEPGFVSSSENDGDRAVPRTEAAEVGGTPATEQDDRAHETEPGGSRWKLRNWRLRSKLAAVLIVPMVTAVILGGLRTADELNRAEEFGQTVDQVDVAARLTAVVHALQAERTLAVDRVASGSLERAALDSQIARVDAAVRDLRSAADELDTDDPAANARYARGLQRLDALSALRNAISNTNYPDMAAFVAYNSILDALVQLGREVNAAVTERELLRQGTLVQSLSEAKEATAKENAALHIAAGRNQFPADLLERTFAAQAGARAGIDDFLANASPAQQQLYSDTVSGTEVDNRERIKLAAFVRDAEGEQLNINNEALTNDGAATRDKMREVESELLGQLRGRAETLAANATESAWVFSGIVLAALIAALALMLIIARSLLSPLRTLRTNALEVAYVRLPETVRRILADPNPMEASRGAVDPVPVQTREEIGEVARSFDVVHERAIRMAAEQALLRENVNRIFVNLSRRSQRLVERQLGVIDRLEAEEQDPDQLASLFELDHLATRLRRNGESLLVLSGAGLAKSVTRSVPSADVIGAAVSEIEQYARVEVGTVPEVAVQGRTIHDLVHLLAELLDNATYFSEPETKVSVRAVVTRRKALAVQITDRGVGMSEDQISEANERLADPPDLDVSVTRRMGLYVVARLAQRHGIEVRLRENEDIEGGVIARIVVPAELLSATPSTESFGPEQLRAPAPERPEESSSPSLPSIPPVRSVSSLPTEPPAPQASPDPGGPPSSPPATLPPVPEPDPEEQTQVVEQAGLKPLDQPISLDDLVGGGASKAAGPFLSSAPDDAPAPPPLPPPRRPREPAEYEERPSGAHRREDAREEATDLSAEDTSYMLSLPADEPRYVPVAPEWPKDEVDGDGSALDDDVPTKRLPIYQSVLSRWFSEEGEEPVEQDDYADAEPEQEQQRADAAEEPEGAAVASEWTSVSDNGWQAAQSLLESKNEEVTPAGLPKRVPNAYLVPGSVSPSESNAFTDTTSAQPGEGAIARSAAAARNRMVSFQRGYQSGRHALREDDDVTDSTYRPDAVGVNGRGGVQGTGDRSAEHGAKE
ncbi:histidine kinase/DNA gyrase B/HSP90-like ATPase [Amycolatopsis cihanbeyliensis]|uniref:histidine kinase n=1 Tax=Amycolatopsis cihanbeyliensis TaxID=1128664 RepID=A0A542DIK3_AMYCI|nr:histidine kinase/DNA gyrase B/HSP90-like ATPase [Amycolatopsis cihanbeyliensis]